MTNILSRLIVLTSLMSTVFAANHFQQGFATTSAPSGWTDNAMYYNGTANHGTYSGSNGAGFNASGDYLYTAAVNSAGTLTFWVKGSAGTSQIGLKIQKSTNASTWTDVETYPKATFTSTWEERSVTINDTESTLYVRFYIHDRSGNSLYIDDIQLTDYSGSVDPEPSNHASSFSAAKDGYSEIDLTWNDNDGAQAAAGHLVLINTSGSFSDPVDATAQTNDTDLSDNAGKYNVSSGAETYSWTGLTGSTTYYFKIWPYTNTGSDINYKTDGTVPTANVTTDATPSEPSSGDLYISEVAGDGVDANSSDNDGFVEIYNNSGQTQNLANVSLRYFNSNPGSATQTITLSGSITAGGFKTLTQDNTGFTSGYGSGADFVGSNFYFNGGVDGVDLYHSSNGVLDQFNDNGSGQSPWTWDDDNYFERTSLSDGAVSTNWTEISTGTGSPGTANDNSLPVELSVWKAISSRGLVKLFWTTDSEIENQGFIIERSGGHLDKTWTEIASFTTNTDLLGQGSTTAQNDYYFIDKQVKVGKSYSYRLADVDYQGVMTRHAEIKVTVKDAGSDLKPSDVKLHKAFPNPFKPDVNLSFTLENEVAELSLEIYDITGALVQTLSSGHHETGAHSFGWNGFDSNDNAVSSGVYMVRLRAGSVVQIQRMTLLR